MGEMNGVKRYKVPVIKYLSPRGYLVPHGNTYYTVNNTVYLRLIREES